MRRLLVALLAVASVGCNGIIGEADSDAERRVRNPRDPSDPGTPDCVPVSRNDEVRLALHRACAGCHTVGNRPWFASLAAFENGLVYDERYIKRGDPENSRLVQLLYGEADGSYPQMPPNEHYIQLLADGRATLTIEEIAAWIESLPPPPARLFDPMPELFDVRRLTAEEMVTSLQDQLGLTTADFVYTSRAGWELRPYEVPPGRYYVWPGDEAPGLWPGYGLDVRATERFQTLGGPATLLYKKRDNTLGPSAAQTIVQMSQAWCHFAVEKQRPQVMGGVTLSQKSATDAAAIKANIRRLALRMLGEPASDAEVDAIFTELFVPYEATSTTAAWTAVCTSFVRHPLWLTY
jgi:hypothetical protein